MDNKILIGGAIAAVLLLTTMSKDNISSVSQEETKKLIADEKRTFFNPYYDRKSGVGSAPPTLFQTPNSQDQYLINNNDQAQLVLNAYGKPIPAYTESQYQHTAGVGRNVTAIAAYKPLEVYGTRVKETLPLSAQGPGAYNASNASGIIYESPFVDENYTSWSRGTNGSAIN